MTRSQKQKERLAWSLLEETPNAKLVLAEVSSSGARKGIESNGHSVIGPAPPSQLLVLANASSAQTAGSAKSNGGGEEGQMALGSIEGVDAVEKLNETIKTDMETTYQTMSGKTKPDTTLVLNIPDIGRRGRQYSRKARKWLEQRKLIKNETAEKHNDGPGILIVDMAGEEQLSGILNAPFVIWAEKRYNEMTHNRYAVPTVQGGTTSSVNVPFWNLGFNGTGQIVGCGDTGLDVSHCFFRDPDGNSVGGTHRKVQAYNIKGNAEDESGHGTFVAGSLVGSEIGGKADSNEGVAKGARLVFTDIDSGSGSRLDRIPADLFSGYFEPAYMEGARIHSDSWGSNTPSYTTHSSYVDRFLRYYPDFLSFFAGGNFGDLGSGSITAPATAKNSIAVGATLSPRSSNPRGLPNAILTILEDEFGTEIRANDVNGRFESGRLSLSTPTDFTGCEENLKGEGNRMQGTVTVISANTSQCTLAAKVQNAFSAGATSVMFTMPNECSGALALDVATTVPVASTTKTGGKLLKQHIDRAKGAGNEPMATFSQYSPPPEEPWEYIADFSSVGLTPNDRLKPDLVAPGDLIHSSQKSTQCGISIRSGTSMATPIAAGAAAIARQYFSETTGEEAPRGALIKALLINGAKPLRGFDGKSVIQPFPSCRQGFGQVRLDRSLPHPQLESTPSSLFSVSDEIPLAGDADPNNTRSYCVEIVTDEELRVTLSWYDEDPGSPSSGATITNDLDLSVEFSDGSELPLLGDDTNVVERVARKRPPKGPAMISVTTKRQLSSQEFSLVATGAIRTVGVGYDSSRCMEAPPSPPLDASGDDDGASTDGTGVSVPLESQRVGTFTDFLTTNVTLSLNGVGRSADRADAQAMKRFFAERTATSETAVVLTGISRRAMQISVQPETQSSAIVAYKRLCGMAVSANLTMDVRSLGGPFGGVRSTELSITNQASASYVQDAELSDSSSSLWTDQAKKLALISGSAAAVAGAIIIATLAFGKVAGRRRSSSTE